MSCITCHWILSDMVLSQRTGLWTVTPPMRAPTRKIAPLQMNLREWFMKLSRRCRLISNFEKHFTFNSKYLKKIHCWKLNIGRHRAKRKKDLWMTQIISLSWTKEGTWCIAAAWDSRRWARTPNASHAMVLLFEIRMVTLRFFFIAVDVMYQVSLRSLFL